MKRHPALIPLSHDHHHALVEARRLRRAADRDDDPSSAASAFVRFFRSSSVPHFREEEEAFFPLVIDVEEARALLVQALLDHQHLHLLVAALEAGGDIRATMRELGERLEAHVRLEERQLFPLIERVGAAALDEAMATPKGGGPVWGDASEDLNATLLEWRAGVGPPEHVNRERDVLVFVVDGSAKLAIDGEERELVPGEGVIVPKGKRRGITAGRGGVRYLSVHTRRPPLQIRPAGER
jgi:mannose-6-phosphate isomerase-like protein (cupin superfamily)